MSGVYPTPPITPSPPAFVTAAASLGPAATFIPARRMGWLILRRSVTVVRICSAERQTVSMSTHAKPSSHVSDYLRLEAIVCIIGVLKRDNQVERCPYR